MSHPLKLAGAYGSPYSLKMRAVLRYRQIPFRWVLRGSPWDVDFPPVPVALIPAIAFPDADGTYTDAMVDSSPLIMRLETLYSEGRSLVPTDPVVAFLDHLVEDYADEWVTKAMYHYRWHHRYPNAIDKASSLLPLNQRLHASDHQLAESKRFIADRQIGRTALVGSTEQNRPVLEGSYVRLLQLLEAHLTGRAEQGPRTNDFLFGGRPARADFGLYGQLSQLVHWEPDSMQIAVEVAPRVMVWVDWLDDLSWWETTNDDAWVDRDGVAPTTLALLPEIGDTYAPFMIANARALGSGATEVVCEIDDHEYRQGPFAYQGKCLTWLREQHAALSAGDRAVVDRLLAGTGCEQLLTAEV
jgi:glutathione S-transferase